MMQALRRFAEYFSSFRPPLAAVYASGRFFRPISQDIHETPLPELLAIIGGVGSEIRNYPEGKMDEAWVERISSNWWAETVRKTLANEEGLELQPEESQSEFKVSYFLHQASMKQLNCLQARLFDAGVDTNVIYSSDRDLDFLPDGVNKGTAAAFLARELAFDRDHVVVAGNSGNGAKLFEHEFYGVIVANAHEELKLFADERQVYLAPHSHADGVRDGLQYWMPRLSKQHE